MWTLFDFEPFRVFEYNLRRGRKLARDGNQARGTVVGIKGWMQSSDGGGGTPRWDLAVMVRGAGGPFRTGVHQTNVHEPTFRLGMDVDVRHDDKQRTYIDWERTAGLAPLEDPVVQWKRCKAPEDGIVDATQDTKALERGRRTTAAVARVSTSESSFAGVALVSKTTFLLDVAEAAGPRRVELTRQYPPPYAGHLVREGVVLPVAVHPKKPDKITIDWAAAAMAEPGVGVPAAVPRAPARAEPVASAGSVPAPDAARGAVAAPAPTPRDIEAMLAEPVGSELVGGITFEQWVEISAGLRREKVKPREWDAYAAARGVAPGTWADAVRAWESRIAQDWTLGARFGEAFERASKRTR